jgi:hypothetical protein
MAANSTPAAGGGGDPVTDIRTPGVEVEVKLRLHHIARIRLCKIAQKS